MLKKIALCGLFAFASLFTLGTASAGASVHVSIAKRDRVPQIAVPRPPAPQGFCGAGGRGC